MQKKYALVCFQARGIWTYEVPGGMEVEVGRVVGATLRMRKMRGIVVGLTDRKPDFEVKEIQYLSRKKISEENIRVAKWLSEFYCAPMYKCLQLFMPREIWNGKTEQKEKFAKLILSKYEPSKNAVKQFEALRILRELNFCAFKTLQENGIALSTLKNLAEKGVIEVIEQATSTPKFPKVKLEENKIELTLEQKNAIEKINQGGKFLIRGVTGSGKSVIYREVAEQKIEEGKGVIILVPEISLTPQLFSFFTQKFGEGKIAMWHSGLTESEREKIWYKVWSGEIQVVVGSRSALFLPVNNIGLIVLDEEHEWTYKQDQAPRYDARTVAKKMADEHGATLILGSATPRVDSYADANLEKIELEKRIGETPLPEVEVVDLRKHKKSAGIISDKLLNEIGLALEKNEQVLLFLNRRGSAGAMVCTECGHREECPNCDTALAYHELGEKKALICHLCGHLKKPSDVCSHCGSASVKLLGFGTQKLEQELKNKFPKAKIARADKDTATTHKKFHKMYEQFRKGEIDILLGTQMIAQGLDFPQVNLVGIVLADVGLHLPDFRTSERMYNLLTQVSGRSGRREKQGKVVIQTYNPESAVIRAVADGDYREFFANEIALRREHNMPPFREIVKFIVVDKDKSKAYQIAKDLELRLRKLLNKDDEIFCAPALVPRKHGQYYWHVVVFTHEGKKLFGALRSGEKVRVDVEPSDVV